MNAHDRRVDHLEFAVVSLDDGVDETVLHAGLPPVVEVGRLGAIALQQVAPRFAQAQHPRNSVQDPPVVDSRNAARLAQKKRLDD